MKKSIFWVLLTVVLSFSNPANAGGGDCSITAGTGFTADNLYGLWSIEVSSSTGGAYVAEKIANLAVTKNPSDDTKIRLYLLGADTTSISDPNGYQFEGPVTFPISIIDETFSTVGAGMKPGLIASVARASNSKVTIPTSINEVKVACVNITLNATTPQSGTIKLKLIDSTLSTSSSVVESDLISLDIRVWKANNTVTYQPTERKWHLLVDDLNLSEKPVHLADLKLYVRGDTGEIEGILMSPDSDKEGGRIQYDYSEDVTFNGASVQLTQDYSDLLSTATNLKSHQYSAGGLPLRLIFSGSTLSLNEEIPSVNTTIEFDRDNTANDKTDYKPVLKLIAVEDLPTDAISYQSISDDNSLETFRQGGESDTDQRIDPVSDPVSGRPIHPTDNNRTNVDNGGGGGGGKSGGCSMIRKGS